MQQPFGKLLARLRGQQNLSKYELSQRSGVAQSNIHRVETGERGVPEFLTAFNLSVGLDLPPVQRREFLQQALGERMLDELQKWCVYYFLATISDSDLDRVVRFVNSERRFGRFTVTEDSARLFENDIDRMYAVLLEIAERPDRQRERAAIAALVVTAMTISPATGAVEIQDGPLGQENWTSAVAEALRSPVRDAGAVVGGGT